MRNFGKYLASISDLEIQTPQDIANVSRAILEGIGDGSIVVTGLGGSIKALSLMKGTTRLNVSVVMALKEANKRSTKKKSKKGTAKGRGTNSHLKAVKSVKGVK